MKIYVLLKISYDYYTFTDTVAASLNKESLLNYKKDYPLFDYENDEKRRLEIEESGITHYVIEEFESV